MTFLHILSGAQSGVSTPVEVDRLWVVGNGDNAEIYVDSSQSLNYSFKIVADSIQFVSSNCQIYDMAFNPLDFNIGFSLPIAFTVEGTEFAISHSDIFTEQEQKANQVANILLEDMALEDSAIASAIDAEYSDDDVSLFDQQIIDRLQKIENGASYESFSQYLHQPKKQASKLVDRKLKNIIQEFIRDKLGKYFGVFLLLLAKLWKYVYAKLGYYVYVVIIVLVTGIIGVSYLSNQIKQNNLELAHQQQIIALRQEVRSTFVKLDPQFANLVLTEDNGKFYIKGVLDNKLDIVKLKSVFEKYHGVVVVDVLDFNTILPVLEQILSKHKFINAHVSFVASTGMVKFSGLISSYEDIDATQIDINNTYPNIGQLDISQVFLLSDVNKAIDDLFIAPGFINRVQVERNLENGRVVINGYAAISEISDLSAKVTMLNNKYKGVVSIEFHLQDVLTALPFSIAQVYTDNPGWIITTTGKRLYVGGSLDGITLVSINNDEIVFKGKFIIVLKLEDLLVGQYSSNNNGKG